MRDLASFGVGGVLNHGKTWIHLEADGEPEKVMRI